MPKSQKRYKGYWLGKKRPPFSKEWKEKISKNHAKYWLNKENKEIQGKKSPFWKGNKVGYEALHQWVKYHLGKAIKCENKNCKYPKVNQNRILYKKPKRYEWANISKKCKRDFKDYIQLCSSCHRKYDLKEISL